jgi:hypothetical protein
MAKQSKKYCQILAAVLFLRMTLNRVCEYLSIYSICMPSDLDLVICIILDIKMTADDLKLFFLPSYIS